MARKFSQFAIAAASAAAFSMTATPVAAAELPVAGSAKVEAYDADAENVEQYRDRRYRGYRRDRGIDTGDVIAGIAVIGAIAAIASSSSNNRDRDEVVRERYPDRRDSSYPARDTYESRGMDRAVDMCVSEVERGRERVRTIEDAARDASGWHVSGTLDSGGYFTCRIDNTGRIRSVDLQGGYASYESSGYQEARGDRQLSDEAYARARAATRYDTAPPVQAYGQTYDNYADEPRPAYPGGPLPGEPGYEESLRR